MDFDARSPRGFRRREFWGLLGLSLALAGVWLSGPDREAALLPGFASALALLGGAWLACGRPDPLGAAGPPWAGLAALAGAWTLSALGAVDPAQAWSALTRDGIGLLFFVLAWKAARRPRDLRRALSFLAALAALLALYGVYQHAAGLRETSLRLFGLHPPRAPLELAAAARLASGRAFSLFAYPNAFAGWLAGMIPVCLALALSEPGRLRRAAFWSCALALAAGWAASGSLGGGLAAAAGAGLLAWLLPAGERKRRLLAAGFAVLILAGTGILFGLRGDGSAATALAGRFQYAAAAVRMAWEHPGLGVGPGLYGMVQPAYAAGAGYARFAHNAAAQALAEGGAAVLAAWLIFWAALLPRVWAGWRTRAGRRRDHLTAGLAAGAAALILHASMDVDLQFLKNSATFWFWLGALGGLASRSGSGAVKPEPAPMRAGFGARWAGAGPRVLLVLGLIGLTWHGGRPPAAQGWFLAAVSLAAVWRGVRPGSGREIVSKLPFLFWGIAALTLWGLISAWVSPYPGAAWEALLPAALGLAAFALSASLPAGRAVLLAAWPACAAAWGGLALAQAVRTPGLRAAAGWPNPNLLAAFLAAGFLAWVAAAADGRGRPGVRIAQGAGAAGLFAALLATGSFGGLGNAAVGLLALAVWAGVRRPRRAGILAAILAAALAIAVVAPLALGDRLAHPGAFRQNVVERVQMAAAAWRLAWARPGFGWGPGNFGAAFERVSFPNAGAVARFGRTTDFAHNEILQLAAALGLPGLLLALGLGIAAGRAAWRQFRAPTGGRESEDASRAAIWAILAGGLAQAVVDFNWHAPALLIWGLALLGAAWSGTEDASPGPAPAAPTRGQASGSLALALVLVLSVLAARPLLARAGLDAGEAALRAGRLAESLAEFRRAATLAPWNAEAYDGAGRTRLAAARAGQGAQAGAAAAEFARAGSLDRVSYRVPRHAAWAALAQAELLSGEARVRKLGEAESGLREALARAPHQAMILFELGNVLRAQGGLARAAGTWEQAVALEPAFAAAWSNLAAARDALGDARAEASYRRAWEACRAATRAGSDYERELTGMDEAVVRDNFARWLETRGRKQEAAEMRRGPGLP